MKWVEDWFRNILAGHCMDLKEALIKRLDEIEQNLAERIDAIEIAAAEDAGKPVNQATCVFVPAVCKSRRNWSVIASSKALRQNKLTIL